MNAKPELLKLISFSHCPGGAPSRVSKLSKTGTKLMPLPECLRGSAFGFLPTTIREANLSRRAPIAWRTREARFGFLISDLSGLLLTLAVCACLSGCSFLKPAKPTARYFVLTPLSATGPGPAAPNTLAVGLGQVKLPAYLLDTSLAVRKGTNEIEYLPSSLWAERLDTSFQRVLAANLAIVLPAEQVRLSVWQRDAVAAELFVSIEQFDVDTSGRGVLVARWRILSAGGDKLLKAGGSRLSRQGLAPDNSTSAAIDTLSELIADFSRELAQPLREETSAQRASGSK